MKKIIISIEDDSGHITRMTASADAKLILLDLGLQAHENLQALAAVRSRINTSIMALTLETRKPPASAQDIKAAGADGAPEDAAANVLANGPIRMDIRRHEVWVDGRKIGLTPREYGLLECFLRRQGSIIPHREILKEVWGEDHMDDTQYLRVYIGQLRNKLEIAPGLGKLIVAEAGVGYRMDKAQPISRAA